MVNKQSLAFPFSLQSLEPGEPPSPSFCDTNISQAEDVDFSDAVASFFAQPAASAVSQLGSVSETTGQQLFDSSRQDRTAGPAERGDEADAERGAGAELIELSSDEEEGGTSTPPFMPEGEQRFDFAVFVDEVAKRAAHDSQREEDNEEYLALLEESQESALDERVPERDLAELLRLLTSDSPSQHKLSPELEAWKPPTDSQPNRMQVVMPDLEAQRSTGDVLVGSGPSATTYALDVEPDIATRFSFKHASAIDKQHLFIFLPPANFNKNRAFSLPTRWMTSHVLLKSVQQATLESYAYGPLRWLRFCEEEGIPPEERFPMRQEDLASWLSVMAHDYSESYTRKHIDGVRLWHLVHLVPWTFDPVLQAQILRGAAIIAGPPRDPRRPVTIKDIIILRDYLEDDSGGDGVDNTGRDVAILAAALLMFFGMCRAKDVLLPRAKARMGKRGWLRSFDPKYDPSGGDFAFFQATRKDPQMVKLHLPYDKVRKEKGVDIWVSEQARLSTDLEPVSVLQGHFAFNQPGCEDPAFSFIGRDGVSRVFLTKSFFRNTLNKALEARGRAKVNLHGFRIGGFNFYKLNKVDMSNVMLFGRWSSRAMQKYQRKEKKTHAKFMANLEHGMSSDEDLSSSDEASSDEDDEESDEE
jgi:hypothetical protein